MTESLASAFSASESVPGSLGEGVLFLGERDVHLWLCCRDGVTCSDDFKRRVLSRYAAIAPSDWQFVLNEHGKPGLAGACQELDFNLSHSGAWLVCAVTSGTPVGVDIERCNPKRDAMKLARRFFRPEEVVALEACNETGRRNGFYDFWTLKEAAVKARGEALVPGLGARGFALTFCQGPEGERGQIVMTTPDEADTAQYGLLDPIPDYRLAICWQPATRLTPQLRLFRLCEEDAVVECTVSLRASSWLD